MIIGYIDDYDIYGMDMKITDRAEFYHCSKNQIIFRHVKYINRAFADRSWI